MDNARIEQLEMVTERLMRRAGKKITALITPYPISNAVFGDAVKGPILRYMFPCDGVITKGVVKLGIKPKNPIVIGIKLFNEIGSTVKGFALEKKLFSITPNLPIISGDCLEVSLDPMEETVTEVWISFLWMPSVKDVEVKSYLIEELENDLQEKRLTAE